MARQLHRYHTKDDTDKGPDEMATGTMASSRRISSHGSWCGPVSVVHRAGDEQGNMSHALVTRISLAWSTSRCMGLRAAQGDNLLQMAYAVCISFDLAFRDTLVIQY